MLGSTQAQTVKRSLSQCIVMWTLRLIPTAFKPFLYEYAAKLSTRFGYRVTWMVCRLPFNLALKITSNHAIGVNEANAIRFVESLKGVHTQRLIDYASDFKTKKVYMLTTYISGDRICDLWDDLTESDRSMLITQLRSQVCAMRKQTITYDHVICDASGGVVDDPRIPWVIEDDPKIFTSPTEFFEMVWPGLNRTMIPEDLRARVRPFIERNDVPVVFCHGDMIPRNLILPGGLSEWRKGRTTVCLIDWQTAGWMPPSWEALKATWMCVMPDETWFLMMKDLFPESSAELDMDYDWRRRGRVTIV